MKPNNFDKDIQQKFNSRKIEPSAQAWDRLDAMLTVAEEKKQPKKFFWLSIAATFLVFTGIGYVFFQQNQKPEIAFPQNEVVTTKETPSSELENSENTEINTATETESELAIASSKTVHSANKSNSKSKNNSEYKSKPESYSIENEKQNILLAKNENIVSQPEKINQKPIYNYVTPETLLAEAQGQKKDNGNINKYKSTLKVNSNDLLSSVETELNQSFKEKALQKFKQAKSAFVNRNYN